MRRTLLLLVAGLLLTACADTATEPECVRAEKWVAAHQDELPTTLAAFSEYSRAYRTAIYNEVTPQVRVTLWRQHLAAFLAAHPELTPAQHRFVARALADVSMWLAAGPADPRVEVFAKESVALLGEPLTAEAFMRLGGNAPVSPNMTVGPCECATDFNYVYDCGGGECRIEIDCRVTYLGCGMWYFYPCNGMCE